MPVLVTAFGGRIDRIGEEINAKKNVIVELELNTPRAPLFH